MAQVIDPICGMTVDTENASFSAEYQGETFYFCAPGCKKSFEKDPAKYVQQVQPEQTQSEQQTTCSCCQPQHS